MSVIVFAENWSGSFKKSTFEAISYARAIATQLHVPVVALTAGKIEDEHFAQLGNSGADQIVHLDLTASQAADTQILTAFIGAQAKQQKATIIVFSYTYTGKALAGRVSARLSAGLVAGATELPFALAPLQVRKKCFSGKGIATVSVSSPIAIIGLTPNSFQVTARAFVAPVEKVSNLTASGNPVAIQSVVKAEGKIVLTEADIVVSAGRGLKAPENWTMIETLAKNLQAATACSKPVSDIGWRPHEEHVGQTGITIGPNLYIAVGISGAIQHLAGVSSSKTIVVINNDAEAPFFKAADYGVVGDAFEVVPRLIASLEKFKAAHN